MKLIVENFGAIKKIEIDLSKKIYLFVGYNNTGKTYLSNLLYSIFDQETLKDFSESDYNNSLPNSIENEISLSENLITSLLNSFSQYLAEVIIPKSLKISKSHFIVKNLVINFQYIESEIRKPTLSSGASIAIQKKNDNGLNEISIFSLIKDENSMLAKIKHKTNEEIYRELPNDFFDNIPKNKFEKDINSVKQNVTKSLAHSVLNLLLQNKEKPFFLPANRIFLLENADELANQDYARKKEMAEIFMEALENKTLDKQALRDLLAKKAESKHPEHIANLIELIANLRKNKDENFVQNGTRFYDTLLKKMATIMGGEIVMEKPSPSSDWTEKFKMNTIEEEPINLYLASSSVNQLGTLFQYLKYWAKQQENFLMIDEPEINLHPQNQIQLINLILEFATTNNNRLLLTTHSPLVAETINNYLILDKIKELEIEVSEEVKEIPYFNLNFDLNNDDIATYSFAKNGHFEQYDFKKYSLFFKTFNQEIGKIAEIKSILTDQIYYHQDKLN